MTDMNGLLTLILPLRGREAFTLRLMEYLDRSRFPFRLIIADGSDNEIINHTLSTAEAFPNVDYRYIRYPFDADYSAYYRKMGAALSEVTTPYASLLDNDCFPVAEGLRDALTFLESHEEYSTCRGQHIDFELIPREGEKELLYGSSLIAHPDYFDREDTIWRSFDSLDPVERFMDWSHCMNIMYYNVHRTDVLLDAWSFIENNDLCDLFCTDLAVALNGLAHGKSKVIDTPYTMRQQNSPEGVSREVTRSTDILDRMLLEKWTRDINRLIEHIAAKVADSTGRSMSDAVPEVKLAIKNHYADRLYSHLEKRHRAKVGGDPQTPVVQQQRKPIRMEGGVHSESVHPAMSGIVEFLTGQGSAR